MTVGTQRSPRTVDIREVVEKPETLPWRALFNEIWTEQEEKPNAKIY